MNVVNISRPRNIFLICLVLAVISGVLASSSIYKSRVLTTELAQVQKNIQRLLVEQNSLHIEKGLHGSFNQIERKAKEVLSMTSPDSDSVVVLSVERGVK